MDNAFPLESRNGKMMSPWYHFSCRWCILKIFVPKPLTFCFQIFILQAERAWSLSKTIERKLCYRFLMTTSFPLHFYMEMHPKHTWSIVRSNYTAFKICEHYELRSMKILAITCSHHCRNSIPTSSFLFTKHILF